MESPLRIYFGDLTYNTVALATEVFPLNVGYVAAHALKQHGPRIDARLFKYIDDLERAICENPPDILALSNYPWCHNVSIEIFRFLRQMRPEAICVMGGPNFPHEREDQEKFLRGRPEIDAYVYLEGEIGFANLVGEVIGAGSLVDARRLLRETPIAGCSQLDVMGRVLTGPAAIRVKELDEIPSPYLMGLMDPFFDGQLAPMISTTRGCPFHCTFCADGTTLVDRVNRFSLERVTAELRYIAAHVPPNTHSLFVADLNFGMFSRDTEIAEEIAKCHEEFGYPSFIDATTGKNSKRRVIAAVRSLGSMLNLSMSVQSLDPMVLENIKRDNIRVEDFMELQPVIREAGLPTHSEVILGLPGETYDSHLRTLGTLLDSEIDHIGSYSLMMLNGAVLSTHEEREKWRLRSKFRVLPRDFACLSNGVKVVEVEEVVVATSTLSFEEYVESRKVALLVGVVNNNAGFRPLRRFLITNGMHMMDLLLAMLGSVNAGEGPKEVVEILQDYEKDVVGELWDSPEAIRKFFQDDEHYRGLLEGRYGMNLLQSYRARSLATIMDRWADQVFAHARRLFERSDRFDACIQDQFEQIERFSRAKMHNVFGPDRMETVREELLRYDFEAWLNDTRRRGLEKFALNPPRRLRFMITPEQYRQVEDALTIFGNTPHGRAKTLIRVSPNALWRVPVAVE